MSDYEALKASFDWEQLKEKIKSTSDYKGLNIAYEALDKQVQQGNGKKIAIRFINKQEKRIDYTYQKLKEVSNQFANVLNRLAISKQDVVCVMANRIPQLYFSALGIWKAGATFCPLYSAFGPEPIKSRLTISAAMVLITTKKLYLKKIKPIRSELAALKHIIFIGDDNGPVDEAMSFDDLVANESSDFGLPDTAAEDMATLHFTSGTTGKPKGTIHVHQSLLTHYHTGKIALDLHNDDVFWCTADPGWVTGTSYGIIAPLLNGVTSIIDESEFDAQRWYDILEQENVSVWYTAPTAIRMMMKMGSEQLTKHHFPNLRFIASVGEPLNPEAVWWIWENFKLSIHDNWWQSETGGIMVANYASMDIKPGSMGKPLPGIEAAIVKRSKQGLTIIKEPNVNGELAIKVSWPSMFRGYLHEQQRYEQCFIDGYYLTGDLAKKDEDGYFWFVGRADDIIKTSGHMVGPFEVESVLMEHPAVAEAGVIGKPDPISMELVKAFVSLNSGFEESEELKLELIGFARKRLGVAIAPKEIDFISSLPKTRSGKIMRRLLKARELGLPEGDISTLEKES
jgi:acetyl-CoA synthetase